MVRTLEGVVTEGKLKLRGSLKGVRSAKAVLVVIDTGSRARDGLLRLIKSAGILRKGPEPSAYERKVRSEWARN